MSFQTLHVTIKLRLFLLFLTTVSTMTVLPYLIIYFANLKGSIITGLLFFFVMLANVSGSVVGGYVSDKIGRKKIILLSEFTVFLGFIGAAFSNSPWGVFPYVTFLFFILIQFSTGAATPVYQALIIDISSPNERKTIYTYAYWVRNIGIALGSMIGAFLFFSHLFYLFLGVAIASLCSVLITLFFIKETYVPLSVLKKQEVHSTVHVLRTYTKILSHRFFTVFSIASLLIVSVEEQLTNYIGVRLAKEISDPVPLTPFFPFNVDGVNLLGILKTENTILIVALTFLVSYMIRKWKDKNSLLLGLLLFFVGYTVISISTNPSTLLIAMFIASIGEVMHIPVKQAMLSTIVPDHARSTYMAVYTVAVILGVSTAGIFMIISNWLSPIILTAVIAIMGVVSITLFFQLTLTETTGELDKRRSRAL